MNKVDKLGFNEKDKVEFLKEMLYFSSKEREDIVDDLLTKLKQTKLLKKKFSRGCKHYL